MKVCNRCKQPKDFELFRTKKLICKKCEGIAALKYYHRRKIEDPEFLTNHAKAERVRRQTNQIEYNDQQQNRYYEKKKEWLKEQRRTNPAKHLYIAAKKRAKEIGLEFSIDMSDVVVPEVCPILGIPLRVADRIANANSPTLDRIDNLKGYIKGNVAVISYRANTIKGDLTIPLLERILEYVRGKNEKFQTME